MSRTFAYVRVSTAGQTAENQILEIATAGFAVEPHQVVSETVSGSEAIARRAGFSRLLDRMERGDVLVVTRHWQVKDLNNRVEAEHGRLERVIRPTLGFKSRSRATTARGGWSAAGPMSVAAS